MPDPPSLPTEESTQNQVAELLRSPDPEQVREGLQALATETLQASHNLSRAALEIFNLLDRYEASASSISLKGDDKAINEAEPSLADEIEDSIRSVGQRQLEAAARANAFRSTNPSEPSKLDKPNKPIPSVNSAVLSRPTINQSSSPDPFPAKTLKKADTPEAKLNKPSDSHAPPATDSKKRNKIWQLLLWIPLLLAAAYASLTALGINIPWQQYIQGTPLEKISERFTAPHNSQKTKPTKSPDTYQDKTAALKETKEKAIAPISVGGKAPSISELERLESAKQADSSEANREPSDAMEAMQNFATAQSPQKKIELSIPSHDLQQRVLSHYHQRQTTIADTHLLELKRTKPISQNETEYLFGVRTVDNAAEFPVLMLRKDDEFLVDWDSWVQGEEETFGEFLNNGADSPTNRPKVFLLLMAAASTTETSGNDVARVIISELLQGKEQEARIAINPTQSSELAKLLLNSKNPVLASAELRWGKSSNGRAEIELTRIVRYWKVLDKALP